MFNTRKRPWQGTSMWKQLFNRLLGNQVKKRNKSIHLNLIIWFSLAVFPTKRVHLILLACQNLVLKVFGFVLSIRTSNGKLCRIEALVLKAFEADFWLSAVIGSASQLVSWQSQKIFSYKRRRRIKWCCSVKHIKRIT